VIFGICERKMAKMLTLYKVIVLAEMCPDQKRNVYFSCNILLFCNALLFVLKVLKNYNCFLN
jgi:hypothetical protein